MEASREVDISEAKGVSDGKDVRLEFTVLYKELGEVKIVLKKRFREFFSLWERLSLKFPAKDIPFTSSRFTLPFYIDGGLAENRRKDCLKFLQFVVSDDEIFATHELQLFLELYDLSDKVYIITGASSGIGLSVAKVLARLGAQVCFACRNEEKTENLLETLKKETSNDNLFFLHLDLTDLATVRKFADSFKQLNLPLHGLINNAGVLMNPGITVDGIENHFSVNYVGHFLLTNLLLDNLKESSPSTIINLGSKAHQSVKSLDLNLVTVESSLMQSTTCYDHSKLALVGFSNFLANRLLGTGVTVNCVYPGVVGTNLRNVIPAILLTGINKTLVHVDEGAHPVLYLLLDQDSQTISGKYFEKQKEITPHSDSLDDSLQANLWKESLKFTGLDV